MSPPEVPDGHSTDGVVVRWERIRLVLPCGMMIIGEGGFVLDSERSSMTEQALIRKARRDW